ncbi:gluconokinase [Anaerolentibacter hominis]|uniref:gluconokinase n=1 Tax=Anaerolentibacter hominis TaxID=3079009 RepID=UPI0031B7EAE7
MERQDKQKEALILVLESSTTSAKAMLYSTLTGAVSVKTKAFEAMYEDITIHDGEKVFQQTAALGRDLCEGREIDMIALSGTWHSLMLCGMDMKPASPVYLWSFTGAAGVCAALRKDESYVSRYYQKTGCMVNAIYPFFKLKYLSEQGYDLSKYRIMGQGTYNNYRLTGACTVMDCMAAGSGLLNTHTKQFDPELLSELGILKDQLSELVTYRETRPLNEEGAGLLGLSPGIPVITAGSDGGLNQIGAGALKEGVMTFSVGTSAAIRLTTAKPILPDNPSTWCYMSPKAWLSGAATSGCCNCVDWVKKELFPAGTSYGEIEAGFGDPETTPVFLPFLFGERCPGWRDDREGAFFDVKPFHRANDMYHAVLEGTLYNVYHCYRMLSGLNGTPRRIKLSGGIIHSKYWTQMCADIFGEPMEVADMEHSSLIGGAALALELLGVIEKAEDFDVETVETIRPDPSKRERYDRKFARYLYWYEKTR